MAATAGEWVEQDSRRILHPVVRVGHLDESIAVYEKAFGLKELRRRDVPQVRMGWGPGSRPPVIKRGGCLPNSGGAVCSPGSGASSLHPPFLLQDKYTLVFMGFGPESKHTALE